jgi:hypothetical protein
LSNTTEEPAMPEYSAKQPPKMEPTHPGAILRLDVLPALNLTVGRPGGRYVDNQPGGSRGSRAIRLNGPACGPRRATGITSWRGSAGRKSCRSGNPGSSASHQRMQQLVCAPGGPAVDRACSQAGVVDLHANAGAEYDVQRNPATHKFAVRLRFEKKGVEG